MERRAVQRTRAAVLVECRVRGRSELAETYDISTDGCMLQASNGFCGAGDEIELAIGGVLLRGSVVWVKHRNAGVRFAGRVSADTLAAIIAADELPQAFALASTAPPAARRIHLAIYGVLALASTLLLVR